MCKILGIIYQCNHEQHFILSRCLGGFATKKNRLYGLEKKHCRPRPYIRIHYELNCGKCCFAAAESAANRRRDDPRASLDSQSKECAEHELNGLLTEDDLERLEDARLKVVKAERVCVKYVASARRAFSHKDELSGKRESVKAKRRTRGSLLRYEVKAKDVVLLATTEMKAAARAQSILTLPPGSPDYYQ